MLIFLGSAMSFAETEVVVIIEEPPVVIVEGEIEDEEYSGNLSDLLSFSCTDNVVTISLNEQEVSIEEEGQVTRRFNLLASPLVFTDGISQFDSGASDKTRVDIFMAVEADPSGTQSVMMQMTRMTSKKESDLLVSLDNNIFYLECN